MAVALPLASGGLRTRRSMLRRYTLASALLFALLFSRKYYLSTNLSLLIQQAVPSPDRVPVSAAKIPTILAGSTEQIQLVIESEKSREPPKPRKESGQEDCGLSERLAIDFTTPSSTLACRTLAGAEDIVVIIKTGATELFNRLPEQLLTLSRCVPKLMIFSDLEQDIGEFHIYDALVGVSDEYKNGHEDFDLYKNLQKSHAEHGDLSELGSKQGWNLDKWKNIPMLQRAFEEYSNTKWFMTIDADTFLGWANLLQLVSQLNSSDPLYAGCIYRYGDFSFVQGGTGYILSRGAVEIFVRSYDAEHIATWENETSTHCCGDVMLGWALHGLGINATGAWPLLQPEPPSRLEWGDWLWCRPAVTWHHVYSYEVEALWHFEQAWIERTAKADGAIEPYLYRDAFEYFLQPHISERRSNWDNLCHDKTFTEPREDHAKENDDWDRKSDEEKQTLWDGWSDFQRKSVESEEDCLLACEADTECMQWVWKPGSCSHNKSIKLGYAVASSNDSISGWMMQRLSQFKQKQEPCDPWKGVLDGLIKP